VLQAHRFRAGAALFAGLLFCASMVSPAQAAPLDALPSIDVVRNRLSLTPEQEASLRPMFQDRGGQLADLRARLEQAATKQERRGILRDARQQADDFNRRVESQLDVSQKQEWRKLRSETREKVKQKIEEQRGT
jgi:hypothetical protein